MATVTAPWGSAGLAPSAPVLCRLCGSVIAAEASFATVGSITLHFECWITRVLDRQAGHDPTDRPRSMP